MQSPQQEEKEQREYYEQKDFEESGMECKNCFLKKRAMLRSFREYINHIHMHKLGTQPAEECSSCVEYAAKLITKDLDS